MRRPLTALVLAALPLAGCGPKTLALSDDPVTRGAQCAVVATADARLAETDVKAPLPFAAQAGVLQYALLTATAGGGYDQAKAASVLKALPETEPAITKGKWQDLKGPCDQAFPEAKAPAKLPDAPLDAQLGCTVLADYVTGAMQSQESNYGAQLTPIRRMRIALDTKVGARLASAGKAKGSEQQDARANAMDRIVHAGALGPVLDECVKRYPGT